MKTFSWRVALLVTLLVVNVQVFNYQSVAKSQEQSVIDLPVGDLSLEEANVPLTLSRVADKYEVPIGVEVSPKDDLLKGKKINLQMSGGTLRDLLNSIVSQNPLYTWEITGGVINVFPKEMNRDPLLKALLKTKFQHFSIEKGTLRINLRESLTKRREVKRLLNANGVKAVNETFTGYDSRPLDRDFSADFSNASLKSILNRVIKESRTKYWIVNRLGTNREELLLNF